MGLFKRIISSKYTKWIYLTTSILGFLILIPFYLTVQPLWGGNAAIVGRILFFPFVALAVIYFILSLVFIFSLSRFSPRWIYTLAGFATAFGLTHLSLAPVQVLFNLAWMNLKTDPGLAGLVFFTPVVTAVFAAPFQALVYGFIGYRLGRREEIVRQVELGQSEVTELAKENIWSISLDAFGIFIVGFLGIAFLNPIFDEFIGLESLVGSTTLSFLR